MLGKDTFKLQQKRFGKELITSEKNICKERQLKNVSYNFRIRKKELN